MTIEQIRRTCLALPGVAEDIKWEDSLVFSVGGKMFVMVNVEPPNRVWFKCSVEDFGELVERDGISPAPYLARAFWVALDNPDEPMERLELEDYLRRGYDQVLAKLSRKRRDEIVASARSGRARRAWSPDGVPISYVATGAHPVSLVFIHGGLAGRTFWRHQLAALSDRFTCVALDLAGHGRSGRNRQFWPIASFAEDVRAVVDALRLTRVVLVGNSLGGAVALDAAALLPGKAIGVIGVDTLHDATQVIPAEYAHQRAEAFRTDFAGACRAMIGSLFHPGAYPKLRAWAEKCMLAMPQDAVVGMMDGMAGYDMAVAFRRAGVPIRAINGDLWPINFAANRAAAPDFDAVVIKGAGHYPMLEQPKEFNRVLAEVVTALA